MKAFEWNKEQINGKWYSVCVNKEHVPMIKHNSDGTYTVCDVKGCPRVERKFNDARKFAIEIHKRLSKFNKSWDKENN